MIRLTVSREYPAIFVDGRPHLVDLASNIILQYPQPLADDGSKSLQRVGELLPLSFGGIRVLLSTTGHLLPQHSFAPLLRALEQCDLGQKNFIGITGAPGSEENDQSNQPTANQSDNEVNGWRHFLETICPSMMKRNRFIDIGSNDKGRCAQK
jgi:hypothetical protein